MFKGRKIVIATKHGKEKVIAPILEKELGVIALLPDNFDTDALGTFSGEVERTKDPLETAIEKCRRAMDISGCDLAVASEGSFGPHPFYFMIPADDELLVLLDRKNNIQIAVRELSTDTNFNAREVKTQKELLDFALGVKFPEHAIILKQSKDNLQDMLKGIHQKDELIRHFDYLMSKYGSCYAETDMRAMHNPSRMKVIEAAAHKLVEKALSCCPQCSTPGFDVTDVRAGLPCVHCGNRTKSTLSYIYVCPKCNYRKEQFYPKGKTVEEPMYCDYCNP